MASNIEITQEVINYLTDHYSHLMNLYEVAAWRNFILNADLKNHSPVSETYLKKLSCLHITSPRIRELMKDGYDAFILNWIKRILLEKPDKIFFNYCLQCGSLARTPFAQQCRFCGYDWHD